MHPHSWLSLGEFVAAAALCGLLLIASVGCTDEKPPLDRDTMRTVLIDLHIAEARLSAPTLNARLPRDSILARHRVAPAQFDSAHAYYARRPDTYHTLYEEVIDSLRRVRNVADSLRGANAAGTSP